MILRNSVGLDKCFLERLIMVAHDCSVPLEVTSGLRSVVENKRVGGVVNSAHLKGLAVDLKVNSSSDRYYIVKSLLSAGFRRIGIGGGHVHVDGSVALSQNVMFIE